MRIDGAIRTDVPAPTAAILFIGLVLPAAMLLKLSGGEFEVDAHVEAAWPVYRRGLSAAGNANASPASSEQGL